MAGPAYFFVWRTPLLAPEAATLMAPPSARPTASGLGPMAPAREATPPAKDGADLWAQGGRRRRP